MTDTVEFGDPIPHDGSNKCPEHARDVRCAISMGGKSWHGRRCNFRGHEWAWSSVTHYRLPADHPFYAKGEQPAEEPTCGGCRWWFVQSSRDGEGVCRYNPPTHKGFPSVLAEEMCSKFTAKGGK